MAMFSRRTAHHAEPNLLSRALRARREAGLGVLDLTQSNPTLTDLPYAHGSLLAALSDPRSLVYEPAAFGLPSARAAVKALMSEAGCDVPSEGIVLTSSTSEAYAFLFKLLCDPGDEVLIPQPSYPLFEHLSAIESVSAVPYQLAYDGAWHIDFDSLRRALGPRTRAIVLVSPNNPTGSFLKQDELVRLASFGVPLISDEVFSGFALAPDARRAGSVLQTDGVLAFALGGLSKFAALPQLKLAWLAATGPRAQLTDALARLELVADTFLSPNTPVQWALPAILATRAPVTAALNARIRRNFAALREAFRDSAAHPLFLEGGWYATLRLPALYEDGAWALTLLEQDGVLTQPGFFYDFLEGSQLVLSLITDEPTFALGIGLIAERVEILAR